MILIGREKELWDIVKPYVIGIGKLKEDAPPEVIEAAEELRKINWESPEQ